jgi:hypothetical protein
MTPLNETELQKLSNVLQTLENDTLKSTGYYRISGGFATANYFNCDDNIIDIELMFGCQSDVDNYVTTEQYKVCRKSFQILN